MDAVSEYISTKYAENDEIITRVTDQVAERLGMSPILEFFQNTFPLSMQKSDVAMRVALFHESLGLHQVLPGHARVLYEEVFLARIARASPLEQEVYDAFRQSQYSLYEVVSVRKNATTGQTEWCLLRDLFTGKRYEYSDPALAGTFLIWDVILGRMYTVSGTNLFSAFAMNVKANQAFAFNRLLLYYWAHWETDRNHLTLRELAEKYPAPFRDFNNFDRNLAGSQLFNERLRNFLRWDCPVVWELFYAMNYLGVKQDSETLAPDGRPFAFVRTEGLLRGGCDEEVCRLLRANPRRFREGKHPFLEYYAYEFYSFEFTALPESLDQQPIHRGTQADLDFEKLFCLPVAEFKTHMDQILREIILFGFTPERAPVIDNPLYNAMPFREIAGFIDVGDDKISCTAYSEGAMSRLCAELESILEELFPVMEPVKQLDSAPKLKRPKYRPRGKKAGGNAYGVNGPDPSEAKEDPRGLKLYRFDARDAGESGKRAWVERPHPLMELKSPAEFANDPATRSELVEMVKQIENFEDYQGRYDSTFTYWAALGLQP